MTVGFPLLATGQAPDYLILHGKRVSLHTNPLEHYFDIHPEKRPTGGLLSTDLWRGYVATFEFLNDRLYVKKVVIEVQDSSDKSKKFRTVERDVTSSVFLNADERFCRWFTAILVIPEGDLINYVHMGYGSTYERYTLITVKNGTQTRTQSFLAKDFAEYRKIQFAKFKKTKEYQTALAEAMKGGGSAEDAEGFLFEFLSEVFLSQEFDADER